MSNNMLLDCRDISYKYPGSNVEVFKDMSYRLSGPGFHALFGPSGVGKTTLAKMMTGDIKKHGGVIHKSNIQRVLYTHNLERIPGWSTVGEHIANTTPDTNKAKIEDLISTFGMETHTNSQFSQLSLGQQNRINLVRYMLQDFDLLIMDESLANVDEVTKEHIILKMKTTFSDLLKRNVSEPNTIIIIIRQLKQIS